MCLHPCHDIVVAVFLVCSHSHLNVVANEPLEERGRHSSVLKGREGGAGTHDIGANGEGPTDPITVNVPCRGSIHNASGGGSTKAGCVEDGGPVIGRLGPGLVLRGVICCGSGVGR